MMRVLGKIALNGAGYAAGGAMDGAIGAKIMLDAGYDSYNILETVRAGAAGGAVVGAAVGIVKEIFHYIDVKYHITSDEDRDFHHGYQHTEEKFIGEMIVSIALMAASGALGHEMLQAIAEMSLGMTAAALAVGSAVMAGACLALFCCCFACAKGLGVKHRHEDSDSHMPRLSAMRASIGSMWARDNAPQAEEVVATPASAPSQTPGSMV
jgi:hypothetical protein